VRCTELAESMCDRIGASYVPVSGAPSCAALPASASCMFPDAGFCNESTDAEAVRKQCEGARGRFSAGPCSRQGAGALCVRSDHVWWVYEGGAHCGSMGMDRCVARGGLYLRAAEATTGCAATLR
jgi:hypothetical protein